MDNQQEPPDEDVNNNHNAAAGYDEPFAKGLPPDEGLILDIGHLASWTLTSAKPDHGIEALQSPDPEQYWQSDGPQPHKLNILFPKRVKIRWVQLYLDYTLDESYTPSRIMFSAGTGLHDLTEIRTIDLHEPRGWQAINVGDYGRNGVIQAFLLQISILTNHQNGKDTHLRGVMVGTPATQAAGLDSVDMEGSWLSEEEKQKFSIR